MAKYKQHVVQFVKKDVTMGFPVIVFGGPELFPPAPFGCKRRPSRKSFPLANVPLPVLELQATCQYVFGELLLSEAK